MHVLNNDYCGASLCAKLLTQKLFSKQSLISSQWDLSTKALLWKHCLFMEYGSQVYKSKVEWYKLCRASDFIFQQDLIPSHFSKQKSITDINVLDLPEKYPDHKKINKSMLSVKRKMRDTRPNDVDKLDISSALLQAHHLHAMLHWCNTISN